MSTGYEEKLNLDNLKLPDGDEMGSRDGCMGFVGSPLNSPKGTNVLRIHPWALSNDKRIVECPTVRSVILDELEKRMRCEKVGEVDPSRDVVFNPRVFFYEAISHLLQPLALPFNLFIDGFIAAQNKVYVGCLAWCRPGSLQFPPLLIECIPLMMMSVLFAFIFLDLHELKVDVCLALTLYTYRSIVIGTKYAFYPPSEYKALSEKVGMDLTRHLVLSWMNCSTELFYDELRVAQLRTGVDLEKQVFYVRKPQSLGGDTNSSGHLYLLRASDLMERLCDYSLTYTKGTTATIGKIGKISHIFIIACLWSPVPPFTYDGLRWEHFVVKIIAQMIISFCWYSMFMFLMAGVVHYHRLHSVLQTTMWAVGLTPPPGGHLIIDKISLQIPANCYTWFHCRVVALDLGKRFQVRITFYVSIALVLLVIAVLGVAMASLSGYIFPTQVLAIVVTITVFVAASLAAVLSCAARCNSVQRNHAGLISVEKLRVRSLHLDTANDDSINHIESVCRALAEIKRGLEALYDLCPVRVLGVRANYELLGQFITTFGTAAAFGFKLLITQYQS